MKYKTIGILGGSGFVGQQLAALLANKSYKVHILCRQPLKYPELSLIENVTVIKGSCFDMPVLEAFCQDVDVMINLVGILNEKRDNGQGFDRAHVELAHRIVQACEKTGVSRMLQMSALNASKDAGSYYLRSKGEAEDWIHQAARNGLQVTSFRPSVIFGRKDSFFNRFAGLLKLMPYFFPLACAQSRFAPVYVDDVCEAFAHALENPQTIGQRYQLCGPNIYTLKELVEYTARMLSLQRKVIGLPDFASRLQGRMLGLLPGKPFTMDNYRSLQTDSVCTEDGLAMLGIKPHAIEAIAPAYLANDNSKGRLDKYRKLPPFAYRKKY
jgi:NADH dehydrogenase